MLVELSRDSRTALHRQIEAAIREAIQTGRLGRGTPLPPTRGLASELGVSRGVVVEAYQQLVAEGYLTSRPGGYTRVAIGPEQGGARARPAPKPAAPIDFCPCRADGSKFPRAAWLRSVRRVFNEASDAEFGYLSGRGTPVLHQALAEYLNRVRGTAARPEAIVICNGYAQGIGLILDVLTAAGANRVAVEIPRPTTTPSRSRAPLACSWSACRSTPTAFAWTPSSAWTLTSSSSPHRISGPPAASSRPSAAPPCCGGRSGATRSWSRTTTTPSTATTARRSGPCKASPPTA
jgi:hypothetical protein